MADLILAWFLQRRRALPRPADRGQHQYLYRFFHLIHHLLMNGRSGSAAHNATARKEPSPAVRTASPE
jgi:hypothetical protein